MIFKYYFELQWWLWVLNDEQWGFSEKKAQETGDVSWTTGKFLFFLITFYCFTNNAF